MSLETRGGDEIKQTVILSIPPLSAKLDMGDWNEHVATQTDKCLCDDPQSSVTEVKISEKKRAEGKSQERQRDRDN